MDFGELTTNDNWTIPDDWSELRQGFANSMRRFEKRRSMLEFAEFIKPRRSVFRPRGRKTQEREASGRSPCDRQGRHNGAGARNGFNADPSSDGRLDEVAAWIGNQRCARIRHERHVLAGDESGHE